MPSWEMMMSAARATTISPQTMVPTRAGESSGGSGPSDGGGVAGPLPSGLPAGAS